MTKRRKQDLVRQVGFMKIGTPSVYSGLLLPNEQCGISNCMVILLIRILFLQPTARHSS